MAGDGQSWKDIKMAKDLLMEPAESLVNPSETGQPVRKRPRKLPSHLNKRSNFVRKMVSSIPQCKEYWKEIFKS